MSFSGSGIGSHSPSLQLSKPTEPPNPSSFLKPPKSQITKEKQRNRSESKECIFFNQDLLKLQIDKFSTTKKQPNTTSNIQGCRFRNYLKAGNSLRVKTQPPNTNILLEKICRFPRPNQHSTSNRPQRRDWFSMRKSNKLNQKDPLLRSLSITTNQQSGPDDQQTTEPQVLRSPAAAADDRRILDPPPGIPQRADNRDRVGGRLQLPPPTSLKRERIEKRKDGSSVLRVPP